MQNILSDKDGENDGDGDGARGNSLGGDCVLKFVESTVNTIPQLRQVFSPARTLFQQFVQSHISFSL